ncbi:EGF-like domain containing protein [Aphelenchoides avenae]|nr:EGF-like domain containing protein [Aphelenchus avenae]
MDTAAVDMLPRPALNYSIFLECGLYGDACAPASLKNAVFPSTASSDSVLGTPAQPSWNAKECPAPFDELYCFNGGQCFAEYLNDDDADFVPLCKCAPNFHGRRCEFLFNPEIYGFSVSRNELETAALSTLVTLVVLAIFVATCCMYLYRRYGKEREILYMASYGETGRNSDIIPFTTSTRRFRQSRLAAIRSVSPGFPAPYATSTEYSSHRHAPLEERQRFLDSMPMTTMHSVVSSS